MQNPQPLSVRSDDDALMDASVSRCASPRPTAEGQSGRPETGQLISIDSPANRSVVNGETAGKSFCQSYLKAQQRAQLFSSRSHDHGHVGFSLRKPSGRNVWTSATSDRSSIANSVGHWNPDIRGCGWTSSSNVSCGTLGGLRCQSRIGARGKVSGYRLNVK